MPITTLDPASALILVDLQTGMLGYPTLRPIEGVLDRAAALARAFRERQRPVVLVNVAGGAPGRTEHGRRTGELPAEALRFPPELEQQPSDHVVTKRTWGAFIATGLEQTLRGAGVTQVVIGGVATSIGVESTARQAYELGFNVALALDAMTDINAEAHANSVERIFPRLGETGSAEEVITRLR
ncbi:MAG: isochorismatase family protein [Rhodospirillales bacterium]|nr:isochorismatase family protein [Rhodospirillales bacterium]